MIPRTERPHRHPSRKSGAALLALLLAIALAPLAIGTAVAAKQGPQVPKGSAQTPKASPQAPKANSGKPTIVLIHGAWANPASWEGEIEGLEAKGYTVFSPPNPLRTLTGDAETIADFIKTIKGPVVLVGHSYGGAVITNAARGLANVKALVYVDAFELEKGESALELTAKFPGSELTSLPKSKVFAPAALPGAPKSDPLLYVQKATFMKAFANGLSAKQGALAAATQSPPALRAISEPSGPPAWKTIPSWYVVGTKDRVLPPAAQLFMAERAGAKITKIPGGHLGLVALPAPITKVIIEAADSVG